MKYLKYIIMASFLFTCEVLIGAYRFTQVNSIVVKSGWKELSDSAVIKLPLLKGKANKDNPNETLANKIKQGDAVTIQMGYKSLKKIYGYEEFKGFVRRVKPNYPLEVECEDYVYLLRKTNIVFSRKNTSLAEVVKYLVSETNKVNTIKIVLKGDIPSVNFEKFRISNVNAAQVLQRLKDEYGVAAYFRGENLYVGLAYSEKLGKVKYNIGGDTGNVISANLTYRSEKENNIKLKAISILKDNKQIKVEVPKNQVDCEVITKFWYGITSETELRALAEKEIEKLRYTGFEGDLGTYLLPRAEHSMIAVITDEEFNSRSGEYFIDSVETTFGRGIRRKVAIGKVI